MLPSELHMGAHTCAYRLTWIWNVCAHSYLDFSVVIQNCDVFIFIKIHDLLTFYYFSSPVQGQTAFDVADEDILGYLEELQKKQNLVCLIAKIAYINEFSKLWISSTILKLL